MKYIFILFLSVISNLALASYHEGEGSSGSSDSGYGSSGSAAAVLVGVGLVAYFVINRNTDEAESEFNNEMNQKRF